jgi:hypothetical protein
MVHCNNGHVYRPEKDQDKMFDILQKSLDLLIDMRYVYNKTDTMQKRELVSMVFDNNLYYQDGIYRTTIMIDVFADKALLMKGEYYLIYEKKG